MSEDVFCDRCGEKMDGPATGIGYWCNNLKCGDESLLSARELFKNNQPKYSKQELIAVLDEVVECIQMGANKQELLLSINAIIERESAK